MLGKLLRARRFAHQTVATANLSSDDELVVIYRTVAGDNGRQRPPYYDKALCAATLLRALESAEAPYRLIVLNDGPSLSEATSVLGPSGTVLTTAGLGNSGSWIACVWLAVEVARRAPSALIYFVEDDYLHTSDAVQVLLDWGRKSDAPFLTLYRHPDNGALGDADTSTSMHQVSSTCLTFAGRGSAIRKHRFWLMSAGAGRTPSDYAMWLAIRGGFSARSLCVLHRLVRPPHRIRLLRSIEDRTRAHPPVLQAPHPPRATHMHEQELAQGVDWGREASSFHFGRDGDPPPQGSVST